MTKKNIFENIKNKLKEKNHKNNNEKQNIKKLSENKGKKTKNEKDKERKSIIISFCILAVFCIVIYCMAITPKTLQNDTFYTIKIGQLIRQNGIDYKDHFSWHENLPYMYPHWLYDVITSLIYDFLGGYYGIYIVTMILSVILGISIFITNKKICKDYFVSFLMTIGQIYMMQDYVAARAQLVTFILFILTIFFIEKFLEKPKWQYGLILIIIPIIIANIHAAVFPFYFVLYLPYIVEYAIAVIIDAHLAHRFYQFFVKERIKRTNSNLKKAKKEKAEYYQKKLADLNKAIEISNENFSKYLIKENDKRKNPYKIKLERNNNTLKLLLIMIICIFTGLLTPIKDMPYTYTWRIMQGNTTQNINEHLPLTLIENKPVLISLAIIIALGMFTKLKIRLRDIFFISGLTLLAFMSRRQVSMLVLFGGFSAARMIADFFEMYDKEGTVEILNYETTILGEVITIFLVFLISYFSYSGIRNDVFVSQSSYPVEACKWIKENLDYKNIKIFNDYNYGSYMLLQDIPVFIDSRCDLYTPEFNGEYDKAKKKFVGKDIFTDYINISSIGTYYNDKFEEYGITHVITKSKSKLNMLISRDSKYKKIYSDNNFIIYEREEENKV